MTVNWKMHLTYFRELTESAHVATAAFLCLQHSQHPSPFASFLAGRLLAFSTMDSDLPNGAALPWRRAVCSLEPAVCSEAACNLKFWRAPLLLFTEQQPQLAHIRLAFSAKYYRYICLIRADDKGNCSVLKLLQRERNDAGRHGDAQCGRARARARICLTSIQNQYIAGGRGAQIWGVYYVGHFVFL